MTSENLLFHDGWLCVTSGDACGDRSGTAGTVYRVRVDDRGPAPGAGTATASAVELACAAAGSVIASGRARKSFCGSRLRAHLGGRRSPARAACAMDRAIARGRRHDGRLPMTRGVRSLRASIARAFRARPGAPPGILPRLTSDTRRAPRTVKPRAPIGRYHH
jgi:hypothetical protein